MGGYLSDQEQIQLIKDWWKNYGSAVILAVVVFFAGNFGLIYWHKYKTQHAERASFTYTQLMNSKIQNKSAEMHLFAKHLMQDDPSSPYASLAAFIVAKDAIKNGNIKQALQPLQWIMAHAKNKSLRQIARIRTARILFAQGNAQQALTILEKIDNKAYLPAIYELKGDILLKMGDKKDAIQAYQTAISTLKSTQTQALLLKLKAQQLVKI